MENLTVAYVLIAAGFLLLVAELFIPSGGVLSVLSFSAIAVGVAMTFFYQVTTGIWTLIGVMITLPIVVMLLFHYWPKTPIGKRFFLQPPEEGETAGAMQVHQELEALRGRIGKTLSTLRPSGVVDFDGRRVDSMTEGMMVDPGQWVRCVDVRAGKVIVRVVEKPNLTDLETADFS